jgi:hypothetical protein
MKTEAFGVQRLVDIIRKISMWFFKRRGGIIIEAQHLEAPLASEQTPENGYAVAEGATNVRRVGRDVECSNPGNGGNIYIRAGKGWRGGRHGVIEFQSPEEKLWIRLHPDGSVEFGPDYNPDEAARDFWNGLGASNPTLALDRMESALNALNALKARIEELGFAPYVFETTTNTRGKTIWERLKEM